MGLNYNHLLYFYTAVNTGNLKSAAETLRLSPSTVSEQIAELEEYFGKSLFRRGRGKLELTDHGQTAYQFARTIFTAGERLKRTLRGTTDLAGTPIEIGVNNSVTELFERNVFMPLFKDESTKIRLRVGELSTLADDLFNYSLDVVLTDREIKESKGIKREIIQQPRYALVASPKLQPKVVTLPADLRTIPFIHYTVYAGVRWEVDQYFYRAGFKPTVIGEVDDTGIMKHAVLDGLCYAILPKAIVQKELQKGDLVSLGDLPDVSVKIYAYYHEKEPTKQIRSVLEYLREKTSQLNF